MKTTIVITEDISFPIDEGIKKFSFQAAKYFVSEDKHNKVFSASKNKDLPSIETLPNNKLLFSLSFFRKINSYKASRIIYIPSSSTTLMSFLRLRLLSMFTNTETTVIVSVQGRKHNKVTKRCIKFIKPDQVIALSNKEASYYHGLGLRSRVTPIGVDTYKYTSVNLNEKFLLRSKLGLPLNSKIVLHVGHINRGRNIGVLKGLQSIGYQVVVIGSTRFGLDTDYKDELEREGFMFINHYIDKIEEYYQASDFYVFPVEASTSAMEFPLSVLEAMACNIPVLSTKFGGLESFLSESEYFKYFTCEKDLIDKVHKIQLHQECSNRERVINCFSWEKIFKSTFQTEI